MESLHDQPQGQLQRDSWDNQAGSFEITLYIHIYHHCPTKFHDNALKFKEISSK